MASNCVTGWQASFNASLCGMMSTAIVSMPTQFSRHLLVSSRPRAPSTQTGNPSLFLFWTPAVQTTTTSQRDEGNDQGSHVRVKVYYWLACWWCQHMWGHCWDHIYDIGASNAFVYNHLQIGNFNTRQAGQKIALIKKTYESLRCHSR